MGKAVLTWAPSIWKTAVGGALLTLITTAFYVLTLAVELPSEFDTERDEQIIFAAQIFLHFMAFFASAFLNRRFTRDLKALQAAFPQEDLSLSVTNKELIVS